MQNIAIATVNTTRSTIMCRAVVWGPKTSASTISATHSIVVTRSSSEEASFMGRKISTPLECPIRATAPTTRTNKMKMITDAAKSEIRCQRLSRRIAEVSETEWSQTMELTTGFSVRAGVVV